MPTKRKSPRRKSPARKSPSKKMTERQFYCVGNKKRVTVPADDICFKNIKNSKMPGGKMPALIAYYEKLDCDLIKFVKHSKAAALKKKYGTC